LDEEVLSALLRQPPAEWLASGAVQVVRSSDGVGAAGAKKR
jgi:hypothetical protein